MVIHDHGSQLLLYHCRLTKDEETVITSPKLQLSGRGGAPSPVRQVPRPVAPARSRRGPFLSLCIRPGARSPREQASRAGTMPLVPQRAPEQSDCALVASLDNVRNLSTVLKAIHFREHATCFATKNGIKVTVENAKCVQANAFIQVCKGRP